MKLLLREKLAYGCGDFASCIYWKTFSAFLPIFYTDVFGIPAAAVGTLILFSRIFDGINDPMMGMLADRTRTRWGKFRPYLLWMCVPFALVGVLTFTTPDLPVAGKILWAWVTYNLIMVLYTAINIPYTALLGVITPDPIERTSVSSIKFVFAFSGGLFTAATLLPMTRWLGGTDSARGWQLAFVVYGLVFVVFFLIAFGGTRERVQPPAAQRTSIRSDLRDLFANGPWLILFGTTIMFTLFVSVRLSATAHYFKYFVGTQVVTLPFSGGPRPFGFTTLVSAFMVVGQAASVLGVLLMPWFVRWVGGKMRAFILCFLGTSLSTAAYAVLPPDAVPAIFALQFVCTITGGPLAALLWTMYADAADYGEWKYGRRSTGLVFSASTMSQKAGWAVGGFAIAQMLALTGFVPNREQSFDVQHGLVMLMSLIPVGFGALSILTMCFYPLDEIRMAGIEAELKARRDALVVAGAEQPS
ncbi:MAG: MFS transporter [Verrucomicrobiota bacterium]